MKKSYEKDEKEEALKELLQLIGANGGKAPYGAVNKLVKKYHTNGFKAVTWQNLYLRLEKMKDAIASNSIIGKNLSISGENTTYSSAAEVLDITDPSANLIIEANGNVIAEANESTSSTTIKRGGQKKDQREQLSLPCKKKRRSNNTLCDSVQ